VANLRRTLLSVTPFDVLKTRLQTVRPSQTIVPSATPASVETICCQTAVLPTSDGSAQAGPGPNSLRQRIAPTSSAPLNTANATCLGATIPSSSTRPSFMPSFSATIGRPGIQAGTIQASGATLVPPAPEGCLHPSKWAGIWGEIVTQEEAERIRRSPLLGGKGITALQEQAREGAKELSRKLAGAGAEGGFFNEIKVIMAEPAGWRGLWKGVGTGLVMSIPSASIYMLGYEYLLVALNGRIPGSTTATSGNQVVITPQHTTLELSNGSTAQSAQSTSTTAGQKQAYLSPVPFVAGSMARTISATVISPIELFRTRLQALPARKWLLLLSFAMIHS
jgi:solute carrier family 25 protein 39/40